MTASWQVPAFDVTAWAPRRHATILIVPVLNEGPHIARLLGRMAHAALSELLDIAIVDGGSTDGSLPAPLLRRSGVRALIVKRGAGRLSAQLRCAYAWALSQGYEGIVTIDGNDKDDPAAVPAFVAALREGVDFIQASRFLAGSHEEHTPPLRRLAVRAVHAPLLACASGFPWTDTTQGFRAYSRRLLTDPRVAPFRDIFGDYELLAYLSYRAPRLGFRCREIATRRCYPKHGKRTKIHAVRGHLALLSTLVRACSGYFDPPITTRARA